MELLRDGLLRDLHTQCRLCHQAIEARDDSKLESHRRRAIAVLEGTIVEIEAVLGGDAPDSINVAELAGLSGPLNILRRALLPFFSHYGPNERYLTALTKALAEEAGLPIITPIVGTFSQAGYRTDTAYKTLNVPAGEAGQMLALPDLVHELGHLLLLEQAGEVLTDFIREILGPYTQSLPNSGAVSGSLLHRQYALSWAAEFFADAIATYICGPSYGWQHIRLNAQSGALAAQSLTNPWLPAEPSSAPQTDRHPSDTARKDVIAIVLRRGGHADAADALEARWAAVTAGAGRAPETYRVTYPAALLEGLCGLTADWCDANDVVAFSEKGRGSVVDQIDVAWRLQLEDPVAYSKTEAGSVTALKECLD
jgi:hypothetical protein